MSKRSPGGWRPTTNLERTRSNRRSEAPAARALPRLELRHERLATTYRFTYAFHAREVRFERDSGGGFTRLFAETFSFHADRHDPAELYLQLEDLWSNARLLGAGAGAREARDLVTRLLAALPGYLDEIVDRLGDPGGQERGTLARVCEDVAVFAMVATRFIADKNLGDEPRLRLPNLHLRKLALRALLELVRARVRAEFLRDYVAGTAELSAAVDPSDLGFFYALASGDQDAIDRSLVAGAERAFYHWLEDVCLDESSDAFDTEGTPFGDRATEVFSAMSAGGSGPVTRARELSPFLRRPANRDCLRVLKKLETWFLRQYDVHHAAVVLHHANRLARGRDDPDARLSRHSRRAYLLALGLPALPFLGAVFAYERAPALFDALVTAEVILVTAAAFWFLVYRFMWKRDLTFFHASVPRIAAGIIVGYLPVFLIDEVWDLAEQSWFAIGAVVVLLASTTLLYIYVEVQRALGDPEEAFRRAVDLFLLGILQSAGFGLVVTTLLGPLMALRNWGDGAGATTLAALREALQPFVGELPRVIGIEPFAAFPTAVLLMSFLAFFIGTFLQLLWEELPITEPM